ncbi:nitroreductase family protein [Occultella gossypii]|uniref:Nitroreductase family protein n=1 Tax=Occultella gossypii TaxID=2800820 RepID=A0ABS7S8C3_9MICO|nr:nitroreductase family protein [Occultella gossypii]MBZ2196552.1 nitroreductase family protein [Occultella gossypii]
MNIDELPTAELASPGPLRESLVAAVLAGTKTATSSLRVSYAVAGEAVPAVGAHRALVDSSGERVAILETTEVRVVRLADVDDDFARAEGEGFTSRAHWRDAHADFWDSPEARAELPAGFVVDDEALVVQEYFRVLGLLSLGQLSDRDGRSPLHSLLGRRRTSRRFGADPVRVAHLGRLLLAAQGPVGAGRRSVPSAHARYPLSLTVVAGNVDELPSGVYRYQPDTDSLTLRVAGDHRWAFADATLVDRDWVAGAAAIVVIGADLDASARHFADQSPAGDRGARYVWLEAGHVSQDLYLQATEDGLGAALVAGVDDDRLHAAADGVLPGGHRPLVLFTVGSMMAPDR